MGSNKHRHILIAPLDWGLGHTTRCVPIIDRLLRSGHIPIFAGNDWQRNYIRLTFPGLETLDLPGYEVRYSSNKQQFLSAIGAQIPRIFRTIRQEHDWLLRLARGRSLDGIISDNRYGLHHPTIPSVFLTHQLQVMSGMRGLADRALLRLHIRFISKFPECWVVDLPGGENLGGKLSHPKRQPPNTQYIGLLSQLAGTNTRPEEEQHLLILLSGPEPQRTILSDLLWQQLSSRREHTVFVEGTKRIPAKTNIPKQIEYHRELTREELLPLLQRASMVVCRSGYSSLMDLVALGKKAILIPTPGQTEQEYLGKYLHGQGVFFCSDQMGFQFEQALEEARHFPFNALSVPGAFALYEQKLDQWIARL